MPVRTTPLVAGEIYHVLNRGNAAIPIFRNQCDYWRFIDTFLYYRYKNVSFRFSDFRNLKKDIRLDLWDKIQGGPKRVEVIAFCLMPNHFHFLLKQIGDEGVCDFLRQFSGSYSHYFNLKHKRKGSLFEGRFKSIRVETESQLLHLSRYIHLNPYSSFVVKDTEQLLVYPYSSLPEYLSASDEETFCKEIILSHFPRKDGYKTFVLDRAGYQESLEEIKHQLLET